MALVEKEAEPLVENILDEDFGLPIPENLRPMLRKNLRL
jgi:hypothetical protein